MKLHTLRTLTGLPLLIALAACGLPAQNGVVACGDDGSARKTGAAVFALGPDDNDDNDEDDDDSNEDDSALQPVFEGLALSDARSGILVLTETIEGPGDPLRVRRCPVLVEPAATSPGGAPRLDALWASRACTFLPDSDAAAHERVVDLRAELEFPAAVAGQAIVRVPLVLPVLARGLVDLPGAGVPALAREESRAVLQGGKRMALEDCSTLINSSSEPPPPGAKLLCYSLNDMSAFEVDPVDVGALAPGPRAALEGALVEASQARARADARLGQESAAALADWRAFARFENHVAKAAVVLAGRLHESRCVAPPEEPTLCAVRSALLDSLRPRLGGVAASSFDEVLASTVPSAAVLTATARLQTTTATGDPAAVAEVYERAFLSYDDDEGEWRATRVARALPELGASFFNVKVAPQGGVRGAILVGFDPANAARAFSPTDGGWLLTLEGGVPFASLLSLEVDDGTGGTSGGVPLRPLPVARPDDDDGPGNPANAVDAGNGGPAQGGNSTMNQGGAPANSGLPVSSGVPANSGRPPRDAMQTTATDPMDNGVAATETGNGSRDAGPATCLVL